MGNRLYLCIGSAIAALVLAACPNPINPPRYGQVAVDFGGSNRATVAPAGIASIEISVKAPDMSDMALTLTAPNLNAVLEIPAGSGRVFTIKAKDAAGRVKFTGESTVEIKAGEKTALSIAMVALFNVAYNVNGTDVAGTVPPGAENLKTGHSLTVADNTGGMSRPGYAFNGWNTAADGSGTAYKPGDTLTIAADQVLYAQWYKAITYKISFNTNGGTGVPPQTVAEKTLAALPDPAPIKAGYTLDGWYKDSALTNKWNFTTSVALSDITLYAKWMVVNYTIAYYLNGGANAPANPTGYSIESVPINLAAPTWGANAFLGWFKDAALTVPASSIPAGTTGHLAVYAKWNVLNYAITFNMNLGSGFMTNQLVPSGATVNLSANAYTRTGYNFLGWSTTAGGGVAYVNGAPYTMGAANVTLYAKWAANSYNVVFNANGGTGSMVAQTYTFDGTAPLNANGFSRPGYTFGGWGIAAGGPVVYANSASFIMNVEAITLYAQWTANSYTITFDSQGGTGAAPPSSNVVYGTMYSVLGVTSRAGYNFDGWWTGIGGTGMRIEANTVMNNVGNQTLYANWISLGAAKEITAFSFVSPAVSGSIVGTSISLTVPSGTDLTALVANFTITGTSVTVGGFPQTSGSTPNNFSAAVNYSVTAADTSTQIYIVEVTVAPSTDAGLSNLVVNSLGYAPAFAPLTINYSANANSTIPNVSVTPTASHAGANIQVKINGGGYVGVASGTPSGSLMLDEPNGSNLIQILVTAEDTFTTRLYAVNINKTVLTTVQSSPNGAVVPVGPQERTPGSSFAITATPNPGYRFLNWTGSASVANPSIASTMYNVGTTDTTATANYIPDFAAGDGAGIPYEITTVQHLKNMNYFRSANYKLMANLDLISEPNWQPIGDNTTYFTGTFNGQGFTLSNLTINASANPDRGLFGVVSGGSIQNLNLTSINFIATGDNSGGLVGRVLGTTAFLNCSVTGTIAGYQMTGGLIGTIYTGANPTVTKCWTNVTITSAVYGSLGGLIGRTEGGTINQCYALGNIGPHTGGTKDYVGGLIGWHQNTNTSNSYARGNVIGSNYVGGLIANNTGSTITNSYSTGSVTGTATMGGLVGGNSGTVTSSYYDQDTSLQSDNTGKGVPQTTANMKVPGTFGGWDTATIWNTIDGSAYPTLRP